MWERYCRGVNAVVFVLSPSQSPKTAGSRDSVFASFPSSRRSFIVDSADPGTFPAARSELHALLEKPPLRGIPLLVHRFARERYAFADPPRVLQVLANKNDIEGHRKVEEVIKELDLATIADREVSCYSVSGTSLVPLNLNARGAELTKGAL